MVYAIDIREAFPPAKNLGGQNATIGTLLAQIVPIITVIGAFLFLVTALYGGITWITAGGDQEKLQKAQAVFRTSITGFFIVLMAFTVIKVFTTVFKIGGPL